MANEKKFDPKKLQKLNDPQRLVDIPPGYICGKLDTRRPDVLVEIGAGTGFFSIAFLRYLNPSRVYACDISDIMIDWIKAKVVPEHPGITPLKSEEHVVPLKDAAADLVFMINLHHELDDPPKTMAEAYRLLKPGGEIFIVDWEKKEMAEGPPQEIRYIPEQVRDQLIASGFSGAKIFNELPKHFLVVAKKGTDPDSH